MWHKAVLMGHWMRQDERVKVEWSQPVTLLIYLLWRKRLEHIFTLKEADGGRWVAYARLTAD